MLELPTPTATLFPSALRLDGHWVQRVIGDRLSPVLYAYANGWLYRSQNSGRTWRLVTSSPRVNDFVMNAIEAHVLYSTTFRSCKEASRLDQLGPIYKSNDGGISWHELPGTSDYRPLFSYAFNAAIVVATDCAGIFVSTDGGQSWTPRPDPGTESLWETHIPDVVVPLYGMDASGERPLGVEAIYAGGVARDGSGVVAYTKDLGRTWLQVTPDVYPAPWGLTALAVDWLNPGQIWFVDSQGVWFSRDNGLSWEFSNSGLSEIPGSANLAGASKRDQSLNKLLIHPSGQLYLSTIQGLYAKSAEGRRWQKIVGTAFDSIEIVDLFFVESLPELLYVSTGAGVHLVRIVE